MPLFHTPDSNFSQNRHDTMGDIYKQNLQLHNHFAFMVAFFARFLSEILTKHNNKETASEGNIWGPFYIPKG